MRKTPPAACARPIQARTKTGGFSGSSTYRFGAGAAFDAREEEPFADARGLAVGLLLLAIPPR
ncbi:hypothetical protein MSA03_17010 [Microbacterium saccharophilum]|nr:hypothetical protein MSA03_17010 [Microbacterium saccharophilum]